MATTDLSVFTKTESPALVTRASPRSSQLP